MRRLTSPQLLFLSEVLRFRAEARSGKGNTHRRKRPAIVGTPEELARRMKPHFEKLDKDAKDAEVRRAHQIMDSWKRQRRLHQQNYSYG